MKRSVIFAFLLPTAALAQQPQTPPSAAFAGQLATMLSEAVDQRAALQQKVEELQKKLDEAKAKPAETPPP